MIAVFCLRSPIMSAPCYLDRQPAVVIQLFFQSLDCPTKLLFARCSKYTRLQADQPASWKHTPCIVRSSEVRFYNRKAPLSLVRHAPCRWHIEESIDDEADLSALLPPRLHTVFIGAYARMSTAAWSHVFSDPRLSQLHELVTFSDLYASELALLASLPKLTRLSFSPSDVHAAIAGLAASSSITRLSLGVSGSAVAPDVLTPMSTLRHLSIQSGVDEWSALAAVCRQIPHITSLSMRWLFPAEVEDWPAIEAALRSLTTLQTLELQSVRDVSLPLQLLAACGSLRTLIMPVSVEDLRADVLRSLEALLDSLPLLRIELIVAPMPSVMPSLGLERVHLRGRYC